MGDIFKLDYPQSDLTPEILAVEHLAQLIHKSPASIRSDASRNPDALPPICRLPGNKRLLWRLIDVQAWIARHVERPPTNIDHRSKVLPTEPKKRGRPRNIVARMEATL